MEGLFPGAGTVVNVVAVLLGAGLGIVAGHRLPARVRAVVTDCLGLVTVVVALASSSEAASDAASGDVSSVSTGSGSVFFFEPPLPRRDPPPDFVAAPPPSTSAKMNLSQAAMNGLGVLRCPSP